MLYSEKMEKLHNFLYEKNEFINFVESNITGYDLVLGQKYFVIYEDNYCYLLLDGIYAIERNKIFFK